MQRSKARTGTKVPPKITPQGSSEGQSGTRNHPQGLPRTTQSELRRARKAPRHPGARPRDLPEPSGTPFGSRRGSPGPPKMMLSLTREQDFPFCVRVAFRTLRPGARTLSWHHLRLSPRPPNTLLEWYCSKGTVPLTHTPRAPPGVGGFNWPAATATDPEKKTVHPDDFHARDVWRGYRCGGLQFCKKNNKGCCMQT